LLVEFQRPPYLLLEGGFLPRRYARDRLFDPRGGPNEG